MGRINYYNFINSTLFEELQSDNLTTEDLFNFVLSLIGVENFVKNHPKPIIEYYWKDNLGNNSTIECLAEKYGVELKPISYGIEDIENRLLHLNYILPKKMKNIVLDENKYPSSIPLEVFDTCEHFENNLEFKDISEYNLKDIELLKKFSSYDIINNETLLNKNYRVNFRSERHSSDYIEHFTTYKTGWYYLSLNPNIKLDKLLISFFKNKKIVLEREEMQVYMAYGRGNVYDTKSESAIRVFSNNEIDEQIIPFIINDPVTWEGVFYSENFCNDSILAYIKNRISDIEKFNL